MSYIRDLHCEASDHATEVCEAAGLPAGCRCKGGDCPWCQAYYAHLADPYSAREELAAIVDEATAAPAPSAAEPDDDEIEAARAKITAARAALTSTQPPAGTAEKGASACACT